ncbi:HAD family phosphatase [Streptomyces sp. S.PNR 29]|uniref:HAD family phosphatase n=1 Tax=Streptomyces sp. S.PNR 29 TaxID=2973805 RepID=UPI0025B1B4D3|nr:HAD family phosphatase [Streptomyces sp. S.PNR 29]MDN0195518.1 HAD family phosphatase [Streptomyces sp. S.PNR 29]
MTTTLQHLRLAAVNIDGVLLNDTFSPVIRAMVTAHGGDYTEDVEYELFSQPQLAAASVFAKATNSPLGPRELVAAYLAQREEHLARHPVRVLDGAGDLLRLLRGLGLQVVCYGGLDRSHFDRHLGEFAPLFDDPGYICTDSFRPGVHEIVHDVFALAYDQVLFIDDVARVAETARSLGVPFIGHPSAESAYQRRLMERTGVRHLVRRLSEIDEELLRTLDHEAAAGAVWDTARPAGAAHEQ